MNETLTALGTIVGTALLLVLRDWRDGKSIFKANDTLPLMRELKSHYNDETTVILTSIRESIEYMNRKLDTIMIDGVRLKK